MFTALAISLWAALSLAPSSNVRPQLSPQVPYDARKAYPVEALKEDLKLLPLIAEIKDGHTRAQLSPAAGAFLDHEPVVFPFGLRFLDDKTYLFRNLSSDPNIKEGAELLSINGMTMAEILPKLLPLIPSDAGIQTRKLRQLEFPATFGRLFALRFGRPGFRDGPGLVVSGKVGGSASAPEAEGARQQQQVERDPDRRDDPERHSEKGGVRVRTHDLGRGCQPDPGDDYDRKLDAQEHLR